MSKGQSYAASYQHPLQVSTLEYSMVGHLRGSAEFSHWQGHSFFFFFSLLVLIFEQISTLPYLPFTLDSPDPIWFCGAFDKPE